jgi:hypothetical protein
MATVVTGLFDVEQEAKRAQGALQAIGIAPSQIHLTHQGESHTASASEGNWWDRL